MFVLAQCFLLIVTTFRLFDYCFAEDHSRMAPGVLDYDGGDVVVIHGVRDFRNG